MMDRSHEHRLEYRPPVVSNRRAALGRITIAVGVVIALVCAGRVVRNLLSERWPSLTVTAPSTGMVELTWKPLAGVQYYQLYRSTNPKFTPDYANLYSSNISSNSYRDNQVSAGTTYYYKVAGVNNTKVMNAGAGSITTPLSDASLIGISTRP